MGDWKLRGKEFQTEVMCRKAWSWEEYDTTNEIVRDLLGFKIGFAMFGLPPLAEPVPGTAWYQDDPARGLFTRPWGHSEATVKAIDAIIDLLVSLNGSPSNVRVYYVLLYMDNDSSGGLIKMATGKFIDSEARVYTGWDDFIENNNLRPIEYCYPKGGTYRSDPLEEDKAWVEYGKSPGATLSGKALRATDIAATSTMIGASVAEVTAIGVGMFVAVPALPVIAVGAAVVGSLGGLWAGGRCIGTLIDRSRHKQTNSLADRRARHLWLGLAGAGTAVLSTGVATALRLSAITGVKVTKGAIVTADICMMSQRVVPAGALVGAAWDYYNGHNFTMSERLVIAANVFFLVQSVVWFRSAEQIYTDTQIHCLSNQKLTQEHTALLSAANATGRARDLMDARATVISELNDLSIRRYMVQGAMNMTRFMLPALSLQRITRLATEYIRPFVGAETWRNLGPLLDNFSAVVDLCNLERINYTEIARLVGILREIAQAWAMRWLREMQPHHLHLIEEWVVRGLERVACWAGMGKERRERLAARVGRAVLVALQEVANPDAVALGILFRLGRAIAEEILRGEDGEGLDDFELPDGEAGAREPGLAAGPVYHGVVEGPRPTDARGFIRALTLDYLFGDRLPNARLNEDGDGGYIEFDNPEEAGATRLEFQRIYQYGEEGTLYRARFIYWTDEIVQQGDDGLRTATTRRTMVRTT